MRASWQLACVASCGLVASIARADSVSVALTDNTLAVLSQADCAESSQTEISFSWARTLTSGDRERVFVSLSDTCTDSDAELETLVSDRTRTSETGSYASTSDPLTPERLFRLAVGAEGCPKGVAESVYLCVVVTPSGDSAVYGSARIDLDSTPPAAPVVDSVDIYDAALGVNWTKPSGTIGLYRLYYGIGGQLTSHVDVSASSTDTTIDGLTNGVEYTLVLTAFDDTGSTARGTDGNESAPSRTQTGTPRASQDFLERYLAQGGTEAGGCASTPAGVGALLTLLLLAIRRRSSPLAAAALAGLALPAGAAPLRSAEGFDLSLRLGSFLPSIDAQAGLTGTPFADIFGTDTRYLGSIEVALPFASGRWGSISGAVSTGFWQATGTGRYPDAGDVASADEVTLRLVPLSFALRYRADALYERLRWPIVPYVQAGYGLARWTTGTDNGTSSDTASGAKGTGWARGYEWAAGLHLVLNSFDQARAAELREEAGVVSSSLFVEYRQVGWVGAGGLRLDGGSWSGGFGLSF